MENTNEINKKSYVKSKTTDVSTKYALADLRKHCFEIFKIREHAFDAITYNLDSSKTYSKDEIEKEIKNWKTKGVI